MALCYSCGNDNGEQRFCTRCGAAQTPEAARIRPRPAGGGASPSTLLWLSALVLGCVAVAASELAGGWRSQERTAAIEEVESSEAWPTLLRIQKLQQQHRKRHGSFTHNLADPAAPDGLAGYTAPREEGFFRFSVPVAGRRELCIEARPTERGRKAGLAVSSMDEKGRHFLGAACEGTVLTHAPADEFVGIGGAGARKRGE